MIHDPLCLKYLGPDESGMDSCDVCWLITQIRDDVQQPVDSTPWLPTAQEIFTEGYLHAVATATKAVTAMPDIEPRIHDEPPSADNPDVLVRRVDVVTLLQSMREPL